MEDRPLLFLHNKPAALNAVAMAERHPLLSIVYCAWPTKPLQCTDPTNTAWEPTTAAKPTLAAQCQRRWAEQSCASR
jgi:hypothetical protein